MLTVNNRHGLIYTGKRDGPNSKLILIKETLENYYYLPKEEAKLIPIPILQHVLMTYCLEYIPKMFLYPSLTSILQFYSI